MNFKSRAIGAGFGLAALAASSLQPAIADGSVARVKSQGYVVSAVGQELPFAELKPDGSLVGVLPDTVRAVLAEAGVGEFKGVVIDWGAMIPGLQARRFDLVSGGLYINPKRCAAILFSEPVLCDAEGFLAKKGNPIGVTGYRELTDHPSALVGACPGCLQHISLKKFGVDKERIILYDGGVQTGVQLVRTGRIDLLTIPMSSAKDALSKMDDADDFELVGPIADVAGGCAAIGFNAKDRELRDAFDAGLMKLQESGEFDAIMEKYGQNAAIVRAASREVLCEGVAN